MASVATEMQEMAGFL